MLSPNFCPSTAMLWPAASVMLASPWQVRQSCARSAGAAANSTAASRPAIAMLPEEPGRFVSVHDFSRAERVPQIGRFSPCGVSAAPLMLPSSFSGDTRRSRTVPVFPLGPLRFANGSCAGGTFQKCAFGADTRSDRYHKHFDIDHKDASRRSALSKWPRDAQHSTFSQEHRWLSDCGFKVPLSHTSPTS